MAVMTGYDYIATMSKSSTSAETDSRITLSVTCYGRERWLFIAGHESHAPTGNSSSSFLMHWLDPSTPAIRLLLLYTIPPTARLVVLRIRSRRTKLQVPFNDFVDGT